MMTAQAQPESHVDDATTEESTRLPHARLYAYPTSGSRVDGPLAEDHHEEVGQGGRVKEEEDETEAQEPEELENEIEMGAASWAGTPSILGSSESIRMALLTVSLVGLQYVQTPAHTKSVGIS